MKKSFWEKCQTILTTSPSVPKTPSVTIKGISAPFSYSYDGDIIKVLDVKVGIEHLWGNEYDITVSASAEALNNMNGSRRINFRVYDSEGFIIKDGLFLLFGRMSAGAKAKDECKVMVEGEDNYTIEFYPERSVISGTTGYFF